MALRILAAVLILLAASAASAGYWHLLGGRGGGSRSVSAAPAPDEGNCTFGSATFPCAF